jgi:hypothetical protein
MEHSLSFVLEGVRMIWIGCFKKFLEVTVRLSHLALEIALGDHDMLLFKAVHFLVVIIIVAGSNCDPLGAPLLPFVAAFGASLSAFDGAFGRCPPPPTTTGDGFSIALNKDGPDFFFTRSVSGGDVKQFLHGLRMVAAEFVH